MPTCQTCFSESVEEENHHGEFCLVCTNCGSLVNDSQVLEDHNDPSVGQSYVGSNDQATTMQGRHYSYKQRLHPSAGRKLGADLLKKAKDVLKVPSPAYYKALEIFRAHRTTDLKLLAAACLMIGIQQNAPEIGLTARQVANFFQVDTTRVRCKVKALGEKLHSTGESTSLSQRLLADLQCDDKAKLLERADRLFELARKQISASMDPTFLALACSFISWKSLRIHTHRKIYLKIERFFEEALVSCGKGQLRTVQKHVQTVRNHLQTLAGKLPWAEKEDTGKHDVFTLVDDVLKYSASLAADVAVEKPTENLPTPSEYVPPKVLPPQMYTEDLSEIDLPEEEEHIYLRSAEEVAALEAWMKKHENDATEKDM